MVNTDLITEELAAAGITNIWFDAAGGMTHENATPQQIAQAEAILAAHNPALLSKSQEIDQARIALAKIRQYLLRQMVSENPATPAQQVTAIKDLANGNTHLNTIMSNQIIEMNDAFGWSLTLNPGNLADRRRFIFTVKALTGVLP